MDAQWRRPHQCMNSLNLVFLLPFFIKSQKRAIFLLFLLQFLYLLFVVAFLLRYFDFGVVGCRVYTLFSRKESKPISHWWISKNFVCLLHAIKTIKSLAREHRLRCGEKKWREMNYGWLFVFGIVNTINKNQSKLMLFWLSVYLFVFHCGCCYCCCCFLFVINFEFGVLLTHHHVLYTIYVDIHIQQEILRVSYIYWTWRMCKIYDINFVIKCHDKVHLVHGFHHHVPFKCLLFSWLFFYLL